MEITLNEVAGHLAFGLSALAYSMRRILWLRVLAISSLVLSLYYNLTLPGGILWLVVFWLTIFLLINVTRIVLEIISNLEVPLTPITKRVLTTAFPQMHSRDWLAIEKRGRMVRYKPGDLILGVGQNTHGLSLLFNGSIEEGRQNGKVWVRNPGTIWGELTYSLDDEELGDGSPWVIKAGPKGATVFEIAYPDLKRLAGKNDRLRAALAEGTIRSLSAKHGLLNHDWPVEKNEEMGE